MTDKQSKTKIRAFIAAPLPGNLKRDVDKLIVELKPLASGVTWVKAENLHFTLRFLGDIEADSVPRLRQALESGVKGFSPININLAGLGCFPNMHRPRVIWVAASGETEKMKELAGTVEAACKLAGFGPADKPFAPHLTIGRVKFPGGLAPLLEKLEGAHFETEQFVVDRIVIYKSDLTPRGPIYTSLGEVGLE